jgi:hypothetical protein
MQQQLDRSAPYVPQKNANPAYPLSLACIVIALAVWSFSPAIFSFCTSDDFLIFTWLRQSAGKLDAIAGQFCGPWLGLTQIKYYRPLPMLDWSIQYSVWHDQLLNYHIVNLVTYGLISCLVFLIAFELNKQGHLGTSSPTKSNTLLYPGIAAAIFITYPDHGEAVNWLVGRLDLLATLFLLACTWCHLRWRRTKQLSDLLLALGSLVLAFLSKENAILIPPLLFLTELFLGWSDSLAADRQAPPNWKSQAQRLISSGRTTAVYWIFVPIYLLIRKAAIGELVGGWGPAMSFYSRPIHLEILSSLQHTIIPLNNAVFAGQPAYFLLWCFFLVFAGAGIILTQISSKAQRGFFAFLMAWFVLSLVPTYRFFLIDGNLLNSRLAFMATVPLSLILASGFEYFASRAKWQKAGLLLSGGFVLLASIILHGNNQPWQSAGLEVNRFIAALNAAYKTVPGDPSVQIIGVPLEKDGVYVCLNALPGMTKAPFLMRDVRNCQMVDGRDTLFPVGFMKQQIEAGTAPARLFRWVEATGQLQEIAASRSGSPESEILYPSKANPIQLRKIVGTGRELKNLNLDCWNAEFIKVIFSDPAAGASLSVPTLSFKNDVVADYNRFDICPGVRSNPDKPNEFIFPVGALANWSFGGTCRELLLKYKVKSGDDSQSIEAVPSRLLAPQIRVISKVSCDQNGAITLNAASPNLTVLYDATAIPKCSAVRIEISKTGVVPSVSSDQINSRVIPTTAGTTEINKEVFTEGGTYTLRLRALDADGKPLGQESIHLLIHV